MNFLSEFRTFHQDYKMPLPKGYRINDAGVVALVLNIIF